MNALPDLQVRLSSDILTFAPCLTRRMRRLWQANPIEAIEMKDSARVITIKRPEKDIDTSGRLLQNPFKWKE